MTSTRNDWAPPSQFDAWAETHLLSRRQAIRWGVVAGGALPPPAAIAASSTGPAGVSVESEAAVARPYPNIHGGNGTISVRYFPFDQQPAPAQFVIYEIPPGASEGVHTHHLGDNVQGPFDEYYYIIEGEGEMPIDGQILQVKAGDHIHTPLGVAHGITNTMSAGNLRVFLTFIAR